MEPEERPPSSGILDRLDYRDLGNLDLPLAEAPLDDNQTVESAITELNSPTISVILLDLLSQEPDQAEHGLPSTDVWAFWNEPGGYKTAEAAELNEQCLSIEENPFASGTFSDLYRGRWEPPSNPQGSDVSVRVFKLEADVVNRVYVAYQKRYGKYVGQEVEAWRTFNHPRITPFIGFTRGPKLQAMPCCVTLRRSANLKTYITIVNPQADRLRLLCQALEGLVYLHSFTPNPIIHGALRPENILVTDEGTAELCDLGYAKILDDLDTLLPTSSIPTEYYRYRAPETLKGDRYHELTPGVDIYAMGSTNLFVLSGMGPWHRLNHPGPINIAIVRGELPKEADHPMEGAEGAVKKTWDLLRRCWCMQPDQRPSAAAVLNEFLKIEALGGVRPPATN
ncbi:hypothetical protein FS837_003286 [Tulasnella sp. UAMH 9824]|nr:hypothetical protein FS837_003286 [Tulasnella sp. UAMH 9824]